MVHTHKGVTLVEDIVDNKTEEAELRITEKLQEEVKKCVTNALPTLVEDIVNNKTEEAELRITEKLKGNIISFSNL